jgi:transcription-repair coupling factor (superfamily II helicase)
VRAEYDATEQTALYQLLETTYPSTPEQVAVIDAVVEAIHNPRDATRCHVLAGIAGAGKTQLAMKLAAKVRGEGGLVEICAATTLAAMLYPRGKTAHSLTKFPVQDEEDRDSENPPECR